MIGTTIAHYTITERIGAGGMGEVFRAADSKLGRDVALKMLPATLAQDAERMARFQREAQVLASLNHPSIGAIYGLEEHGGSHFLVLELIEGPTLFDRLAAGRIPRDEALGIARQIAEAVELAHESGVVHRDLKPANVKVTEDGRVKVLDFGLAKAMEDPVQAASGSADPSASPTLTRALSSPISNLTAAHVILGTAAYMSPEQARGTPIDKRTDIWSFGVMLWEMLTANRLFDGETVSDTLAAVLRKEPDWKLLPADTPPLVRRLVRRCLERDPKRRLRDIGDARITLEEVLEAPDDAAVAVPTATRRPAWLSIAPWVVATAALAALGWSWAFRDETRDLSPVMRFTMALAEDQPLDDSPLPMLAISPDGRRIAYVGEREPDGEDVIFSRLTRDLEAVSLPGTEDADSPFFSPDGEWIGFLAQGKLKKVSVLGGPPATLCDVGTMRGGTWGTDGTIVFPTSSRGGLFRVPDAGGEPEPLTLREESGETFRSHRWPQYLPGNHAVIFTSNSGGTDFSAGEIAAYRFGDDSVTTLVENARFGRFVPPGFLVFERGKTLFAARFDPRRLEIDGPAVPVLEGVTSSVDFGSAQMASSSSGTLVYLPDGSEALTKLTWVDREGHEQPASAHERDFGAFDISPTGTHVAVGITNPSDDQEDIWILELERDTLTRLTFDEAADRHPIWSPDGEWITFASNRDGAVMNLYRKRADGTGEVERLITSDEPQWPESWSPDGDVLAFTQRTRDGGTDIMLYRPGADSQIEVFLATTVWEGHPQFSPDGRFVAYTSTGSSRADVFVRSSDGTGPQVKVSTSGGWLGRWAGNDELLYRQGGGDEIQSVSLSLEAGALKPARPQPVIELPRPPWTPLFRVSPDGRRILALKRVEGTATRRDPVVVINWIAELEAKVPVAK